MDSGEEHLSEESLSSTLFLCNQLCTLLLSTIYRNLSLVCMLSKYKPESQLVFDSTS